MPSLTIHIAIAEEYYKKNKFEIKNHDDFINGSIAPDINKNIDKNISHYGIWDRTSSYVDFKKFFNDEKVNISSDYWKGYFLHLIADHYFYNYSFKEEYLNSINSNEDLHSDYYFLNNDLINDYNLKIIDNIKEFMIAKEGKCKYLNYSKIKEFIQDITNRKIEEYICDINEHKL